MRSCLIRQLYQLPTCDFQIICTSCEVFVLSRTTLGIKKLRLRALVTLGIRNQILSNNKRRTQYPFSNPCDISGDSLCAYRLPIVHSTAEKTG